MKDIGDTLFSLPTLRALYLDAAMATSKAENNKWSKIYYFFSFVVFFDIPSIFYFPLKYKQCFWLSGCSWVGGNH